MTRHEDELRRLLREALPDDLPEELAQPLRASLRPAWGRAASAGAEATEPPAFGWVRALLPSAALLMVAAGALLHASAPPRVLAESLSLRKMVQQVTLCLAEAVAMRCDIEATDRDGAPRIHRIEWRSGQGTSVRTEDAGGALLATLHLPAEAARSLGLATLPPDATAPGLPDPARALLSPARVVGLLEGRWQAAPPMAASRREVSVFVVSGTGGSGTLRVTLDAGTSLPVSIESAAARQAGAFRSRCEWSLAPSGPSLVRSGPGAAESRP